MNPEVDSVPADEHDAGPADAHGSGPTPAPGRTAQEARADGTAVRRAVLGDEHVDRAVAATDAFTAPFQDLVTRYAWGEVWTRPGLDRRSRSIVTLTALVAGEHWGELGMHVRGALRNGLSVDEVAEVLLQCAVYCSVPSANRAFAIARDVLREDGLLGPAPAADEA